MSFRRSVVLLKAIGKDYGAKIENSKGKNTIKDGISNNNNNNTINATTTENIYRPRTIRFKDSNGNTHTGRHAELKLQKYIGLSVFIIFCGAPIGGLLLSKLWLYEPYINIKNSIDNSIKNSINNMFGAGSASANFLNTSTTGDRHSKTTTTNNSNASRRKDDFLKTMYGLHPEGSPKEKFKDCAKDIKEETDDPNYDDRINNSFIHRKKKKSNSNSTSVSTSTSTSNESCCSSKK